jgi:glycosyltransferase 2 family protein
MPATLIGYMANNVLPLRAGEVVRVYVVARRWSRSGALSMGQAFWLVLATLVVERIFDSLTLVLIIGVLILLVPVPPALEWAAGVLLAIDVAGIAVLVTAARAPELAHRLLARLTGGWPALERRLLPLLETALRGLEGVRTPRHALPLAAWTVVAWTVPAVAAWAMLRAMHLELPLVAGWAVLAAAGVGISLPSAPGYVGVFHAAVALALGIFGVAPATAVGYALLLHASQFVPVTLIGWAALVREQMSLADAVQGGPGTATPPAAPPTPAGGRPTT